MIAELLGLSRRERRYDGGYSLENPNLPLNDPKVWDEVFGGSFGTDTGESMSQSKALRYAPVWHAVSLISGHVAELPLDLYRRMANDGREVDAKDPRQRLVNVMANEETNTFKFWRRLMVHALLWGNGYAWIERDAVGFPVGLFNLLPDRTRPERIGRDLYYVTEAGGKLNVMQPGDVLHVEGLGYEGGMGIDLVNAARDSFALGLAQQKFASKFFKNGARVGGILELPAAMPKAAKDTTEDGFRKTYEGTDNPFKTVILRDGAKFHSAQTNPRDSQLSEATEGQVRQVAHWFVLQPSKLGIKDSSSYNEKSEDNQSFLDDTLKPWLAGIRRECNTKMLTQQEQLSHYFEHNPNALLRLNQYKRYQAYELGIRSQFLNPNEVRARENMLPYDGGDEFINPNRSPDVAATDTEDKGEPADTQQPVAPPADVAKQAMNGAQVTSLVELLSKVANGELPADSAKATIAAAYPLLTEAEIGAMVMPLIKFEPVKPDPPPAPVVPKPAPTSDEANRSRILFGLTKLARHRASKGGASFCDWLDHDLPNERKEAIDLVGSDAIVSLCVQKYKGVAERAKPANLIAAVEALSAELERGEEWKDDSKKAT